MHTKDKIMEALQELRDNYNPIIQNPTYRGAMEKHVFFIVNQITEKIHMTPATVRKWCHVLDDEKLIFLRWRKCYTASDPMTMEFRRRDAEMVKLRNMTVAELREEDERLMARIRGV